MEMVGSRRERNKEMTRAAIHEAALALTEERGLPAVTLEAITERAEVSLRTFSNYFGSKEDAVLGLGRDGGEDLAEALAARPESESAFEALQAVLFDHVALRFQAVAAAVRRVRLAKSEPALKARLAARFEQMTTQLVTGVAQRLDMDPEVDLYPGLLVAVCANTSRSVLLWWAGQDSPPALVEVWREAFACLGRGLASPPPPRPRSGKN
jgi:AcrR family transcriptional regulator